MDYAFENFRALPIDSGCVVITYIATVKRLYHGQPQFNRARRSSIWISQEGVWRVIFHQATPLPSPAPSCR